MENLEIKVGIQIQKTPEEVYGAIVDPAHMSGYFISDSTGRMEEGKELVWHFPEFADDCPVRVGKLEQDRYVSFTWAGEGGQDSLVEITLDRQPKGDTKLTVTEKSRPNTPAGIQWLRGNTEGWANFLACMKAYLEYGIHLRKGAFDFMRKA